MSTFFIHAIQAVFATRVFLDRQPLALI